VVFSTQEQIRQLTRAYEGERFDDGRPRVSDDLIERMKLVTTEEAWGVLRRNGFNYQFAGNWINMHPDRILVGRAVTAAYVPIRPDLNERVETVGRSEGRIGGQNSWIIDTLVENDVLVVDLFGKVKDGTFVGDNLSTSIHAKARTGAVIDGGIRDYQRIMELPDFNIFCRGIDPTAINEVTLNSVNAPIRIDQATVLPGDVVLGTPSGVIFIPPQLAEEVVVHSEETRLRDTFGKQRLAEGKYTPGEIDVPNWEKPIDDDFAEWRKERNM
jgi:4-hydroxy-4-methyl-2-oxoglutarate aldolase